MKKILISLLVLSLFGCSRVSSLNNYGQGGKNASQYVLQQVPELSEYIESVAATKEDSLLTDRMLAFGQVQFAKAGTDYWQDKICRKQYQHIIDSTAQALQDVQNSWIYGDIVNDSLKTLTKYINNWAKVYTVTVKMKSGVEKMVRVLMDGDGITPRMTEQQFSTKLDDYSNRILEAQRDIYRK